ncbi:xanthine dehydrogenase-like [Protopterus annectens]|uniref:xanthine dehydrogenase-like n=1 Tax=Protopterus annectens TaxID=7888 RepID=UPI001CFA39C9|nr:xanthine dehydrogenase-like [Protopterus annectens]
MADSPTRTLQTQRWKACREPRKYSVNVNGAHFNIADLDPQMSLNEYLRSLLNLCGTKFMCYEGGCGACIVVLEYDDPGNTGKRVVKSVNSCLFPIGSLLSMKNSQVTTVEALGSVKTGLNPIQERLASHNGSQCGFCSPGFVMQMYGLLKNNQTPSLQQVEDNFDGNICRCTGYRPILDAMKSFAVEGDSRQKGTLTDIEELKICKKTGQPCLRIGPDETVGCRRSEDGNSALFFKKDGTQWFQPTTLTELFMIIQEHQHDGIKLLNGDTAKGIYRGDGPYSILIDMKGIRELYSVNMDAGGLKVYSNVSLTSLIDYLNEYSSKSQSYSIIADHLSKVASDPVRNSLSYVGILVQLWKHRTYPSSMFVHSEAQGEKLHIMHIVEVMPYVLLRILHVDMFGEVILNVYIPVLSDGESMRTFKVMPRAQNAHAYISAGFRAKIKSKDGNQMVESISMVYTGISQDFVHAVKTENYLQGKDITSEATLQGALATLDKEIIPDEKNPLLTSAQYRKNVALGLFYKFYLSLLSDQIVSPRNRSARSVLHRPISSGKQVFSTRPEEYPLTQPMPTIAAKLQTSGEAAYVNDSLPLPNELYANFVLSTEGNATIDNIDINSAMEVPGAVTVLTAKDVPGSNTFMPLPNEIEEVFCSGNVLYNGQTIALCVADSSDTARQMTSRVKVMYKDVKPPIITVDDAIAKQSFFPPTQDDLIVGDPEGAISKSPFKVEGEIRVGEQYHFHMETQICRCVPTEDGLDVQASSQWLDLLQQAVAGAIGTDAKNINIVTRRLGGAYGGKATRANLVACAAAVAATKLKRPVRCSMSLGTNMKSIGRRHNYLTKYKVGFNKDGTLNGIIFTYYCNNGCSPNDDEVGVSLIFSDNTYKCSNWHIKPIALKTNIPATTWCRAPGSLQNIFFIETVMEHIASYLSLDPIDVKQRNLYAKGDITPLGYPLPYCSIQDLYAALLQKAQVKTRQDAIQDFNSKNRWKKRGLAVCPLKYAMGWVGGCFLCTVTILASDGTVVVSHGGIECGQGLNTKVAQVCAFVLGVPINNISIKPTNNWCSPNSGPTGGSVGSELNCLGVQKSCEILNERIKPIKDKLPPGTPWNEIIMKCFSAGVNLTAQYWVWPEPQPDYAPQYNSYGVTVAEAELDVLTGEHQLSQVDILFDCGESLNPAIDVGQVEGCFVMGLGYWFTEKVIYDLNTGALLTNNTWEYKPPSSKDIPIIFNIELLKDAPNPTGVLRSKASGEPPLCMSSAALFAVKRAVESARAETGQKDYFSLNGPSGIDTIQTSCLVDYKQFSL